MNETTRQILTVLRDTDRFVSSQGLCEVLGISRTAVWKQIEQLRHLGYVIDSLPHHGYRLVRAPDIAHALEVQSLLETQSFGRVLEYRETTESTNADADRFAQEGAPEGMAVVADRQLHGRGRLTRSWHSPAGLNLYISLVLRPTVTPREAPQLAIVAACAVCEVADALGVEPKASIKWPNDVLVDGRKLAGILCNMQAEVDRVRHVILGIGLNVNMDRTDFPEPIGERATSLYLATGQTHRRAEVCACLLNCLETAYTTWLEHGMAPFLPVWNARSALRDQEIAIETLSGTLQGTVTGLAPDGALCLTDSTGNPFSIYSGDVHIVPR